MGWYQIALDYLIDQSVNKTSVTDEWLTGVLVAINHAYQRSGLEVM